MKKLAFIIITAFVLNLIPTGGVCVDGVDFGFCVQNKGFPFQSIFVGGELENIPLSHAEKFWNERIIGTIANTIVAGAGVLLITRLQKN